MVNFLNVIVLLLGVNLGNCILLIEILNKNAVMQFNFFYVL
ncbi:putative membrane protein [Acinetobacter baumannii 573719]|nr:putative membrane protein [Acinetobacter baumannii 573719]